MSNKPKFSYNNFIFQKSNNSGRQESSYLNRLNGNTTFKEKIIKDYKYNIPQYYLPDNNQKSRIKSFHTIDSELNLFNKKYEQLKTILELNKSTLKIPLSNLKLKCSIDNNLIFQDVDFKQASDSNYLVKNQKIFKNLKEYRIEKKIYNNIDNNIFIKILTDKLNSKEKLIFVKLYNDLHKIIKKLLKNEYSTGVMGFRQLFYTDNGIKDNNNEINKNKYILVKSNGNSNNSKLSKNQKIDNAISDQTDLYLPYDISKVMNETKEKIDTNLLKFHKLSLQLSQDAYTNIYDLLNIVLDQEYHLINFIMYFNDTEIFEKILKQDNKIRKYIKRNIVHYSSYKDDYKRPSIPVDKIEDMFSIPSYDINKFF
jgi:hypothetical protein